MTPSQRANAVRAKLLELTEAMNEAAQDGVKIEFSVDTDPVTLRSKIGRFLAFCTLKLDN